MNCASCGHENREGRRFCGQCGGPLATVCPSCGGIDEEGERFCGRCGADLTPEAAQPAPRPGRDRDLRDYTPKHLAEVILRSKSALEGERKQVTVLFADVKGSVELSGQVDPEAWHGIMDRFLQLLTDGVHRFGGHVNQYTGDGIMALFGAPIAHEDHAQRACYAVLRLEDELRDYADELRRTRGLSFSTRMGLNSGEVVVGKIGEDLRMDYTAHGQTVGLASRVEQLAEPGHAYLTDHTARLVEGFFALRDLGEFDLRGAEVPLRVHELKGAGTLRTRLDLSRARGFSRFVGRVDEMATLEASLRRAAEGNGQVIGIVGEAGVGKSRLCAHFIARCEARGTSVYEAHCLSHGSNVPFLPLLDLLRDLFGIDARDSNRTAREKIAGRLLLADPVFREALPVVFEFLGVPDPESPAPPAASEAQERQLLAFIRRLVQSESERGPTILLFDDLHWIDPGSDALLSQIVEAVDGTRTLLLANFRPEYHADWMGKSYYQQLPLHPLGPEDIDELLRELLGGDASVAALPEHIRARTGGNPFFVEEVVQGLAESGSLDGERGAYRLVRPVAEIEIPATVLSVLSARIDRLPEREKQVLQTAAVIGREFAEPLLSRVMELPENELAAALGGLESAEFIRLESLYPEAEYAFKHPLTHGVALDSQLKDRRARIHGAIARALKELRADRLDENAALLAHHYEGAGDALEAARWHRRAAEWTGLRDSAGTLQHWQKVRELQSTLPETPETFELGVTARLQIVVFGWRTGLAESDLAKAVEEGKDLARRSGDRRQVAQMLFAEGVYHQRDGRLEEARRAFREAAALGDELGDASIRVAARLRLVVSSSDLRERRRLAEEAISLAGSDPRVGIELSGTSGAIMAHGLLCGTLAHLGLLAEAKQVVERGAELVRDFDDPASEGLFWSFAILVPWSSGDAAVALRYARRAAELSADSTNAPLRSSVAQALGVAHMLAREWDEAIAELQTSRRGGPAGPYLARAYLGAGQPERALEIADELLSVPRGSHGEAFGRIPRALALLRSGGKPACAEVERELERIREICDEEGWGTAKAQVHEIEAEVAQLRGDEDTRLRELREAHRLYTEMGAAGHAERVAKELGSRNPGSGALREPQ